MKQNSSLPSFRFFRPKPDGPVLVLNEHSYVMAEYNQRTGRTSWQRVVLATHKVSIENWLLQNYPVG